MDAGAETAAVSGIEEGDAMMEKDLFSKLDNKKKYLFLSMNSACLTH